MRNFFYRMREAIARFMAGRYGSDKLNFAILIIAIILDIIEAFTGFFLFSVLSTLLCALAIFRMLSKNIPKRYAENQKLEKWLNELKMRKHYHIYRCKNCRQKIRVPRKGGKKVEIRCPKCGQTFIKTI